MPYQTDEGGAEEAEEALLTPCQTAGRDATKELTSYTRKLATIATDLRNIQSVVGRIQTRGEWYTIDRGGGYASPASRDAASDGESDEEEF